MKLQRCQRDEMWHAVNLKRSDLRIVKLRTSPLALFCPYCGAKPERDCTTSHGGLAVVHVLRIQAAALVDGKKKR